jgi:hypothetical protein
MGDFSEVGHDRPVVQKARFVAVNQNRNTAVRLYPVSENEFEFQIKSCFELAAKR